MLRSELVRPSVGFWFFAVCSVTRMGSGSREGIHVGRRHRPDSIDGAEQPGQMRIKVGVLCCESVRVYWRPAAWHAAGVGECRAGQG
jgi:hypothetical protein